MPTITISPKSLQFGSVEKGATSSIKEVVVTGAELTGAMTVGNLAGFNVVKKSGWNDTTGGTLQITFKPTAIKAYSGNITISGGGATSQNIAVTGTGTEVMRRVAFSGTNLLALAEATASVVACLAPETFLKVKSTSGNYTQVEELKTGRTGWVLTAHLK